MDKTTISFLSNFVSQKLSDKFHFDSGQLVFVTTVVGTLLTRLDTGFALGSEDWYYYLIPTLGIAGLVYASVSWYRSRKPDTPTPEKEEKYTLTRIGTHNELAKIKSLLSYFPEFWDPFYDVELVADRGGGTYLFPLPEKKVYFDDKTRGVKGYIVSFKDKKENKEGDAKQDTIPPRGIDLYLERTCGKSGIQYLESLNDVLNGSTKGVSLTMIRVLESRNFSVNMYKNQENKPEQRYEEYILSFFSEHRDRLWTLLSNVHYHPEKFRIFGQEARANLLLYGPPGTGKSSFVHRIAVALGRHLVSIDLTSLLDDRASIYQLIQRSAIDGTTREPKDYIVLLEEFDITVFHLAKRAEERGERGEKEEKGGERRGRESKDRRFQLEDLLEILQGAVPTPGSIIIATTNKYEEMKNLCPALFRAGRLTPVKFDYLSWDALQDLSRHFFKRELSLPPVDRVELPTSDIIEQAMSCTFYEDKGFPMFEEFLRCKLTLSSN